MCQYSRGRYKSNPGEDEQLRHTIDSKRQTQVKGVVATYINIPGVGTSPVGVGAPVVREPGTSLSI